MLDQRQTVGEHSADAAPATGTVGGPSAGGPEVDAQAPRAEARVETGITGVERPGTERVGHAAAGVVASRRAATPPAWGAAHDVPPQEPPVIATLVGAARSGFGRPSSVGPSDEYGSGSSVLASNAPIERLPRASPGVGTLEPSVCASAGRAKRQKSVRCPVGGLPTFMIFRWYVPAAGRKPGVSSSCGSGVTTNDETSGWPECASSTGCVPAASRKSPTV